MSIVKRVLVFGTFDGVHEGHLAFLKQACSAGSGYTKGIPSTGSGNNVSENVCLVVALARDEVAERLKGRRPLRDIGQRTKDLGQTGLVDEVIEGDTDLGSWEVIGKVKPDVIALGYDQVGLKEALEKHIREEGLETEVRVMEAYKPEEYHSSILNF